MKQSKSPSPQKANKLSKEKKAIDMRGKENSPVDIITDYPSLEVMKEIGQLKVPKLKRLTKSLF